MTRSGSTSLYDDDFFAWTKEQAAALRQSHSGVPGDRVDILHIAEEIEDSGKRDLRDVETHLERVIEHLIKIGTQPTSRDIAHWRSETRHFQRSARKAFSPSMRRLLDITRIWAEGRRAAEAYLADVGLRLSTSGATPFDVDDLLAADFDIDAAIAMVANARNA